MNSLIFYTSVPYKYYILCMPWHEEDRDTLACSTESNKGQQKKAFVPTSYSHPLISLSGYSIMP